jgi:hypothetical protein
MHANRPDEAQQLASNGRDDLLPGFGGHELAITMEESVLRSSGGSPSPSQFGHADAWLTSFRSSCGEPAALLERRLDDINVCSFARPIAGS